MKNNSFKKILTILCTSALMVSMFTGCSNSDKKTTNPTPKATAVNYNENKDSNLGQWGRAMGSVLIYLNDGDPYYFGGYEATQDNKKAAANILSSSWNISSREDLLKQIKTLLTTGDRKNFRKEVKEMNAMSKKKLKTALKQLTGTTLVHYQMVQYNDKTWKKKGLLAWDMCRISHLVQWGYVAGYVSVEEAQALIEPAASKLRQNFTSWEEVQTNWLDGYCLFACVDRTASNTEYTNRKAIYEKLAQAQDKEHKLYDDSLFLKDIVKIDSADYETIIKEITPTATPKATKTAKKDSKK